MTDWRETSPTSSANKRSCMVSITANGAVSVHPPDQALDPEHRPPVPAVLYFDHNITAGFHHSGHLAYNTEVRRSG